MRKYIYFSLIVLMFITNLLLILKIQSLNRVEQLGKLSKNINEIYYEKSMVEMSKSLKLLDMKGDTILAKDIFNKKKLVFRYSILNCSDCVNAEFEVLIKEFLSNKSNIENVCLLAYYENTRGLVVDYRKFKEKNIDIQMYILPINQFHIPIEIKNLPYYFTTDSSLTMHDFFIPMKERPDWSISYLRLILQNYFKLERFNKYN